MLNQIKAIAWRRYLVHRRTEAALAKLLMPFIMFLSVAILLENLISIKDDLDPKVSSFKDYRVVNPSYALVYPPSLHNHEFIKQLKNVTESEIIKDINVVPNYYYFENITQMNSKIYEMMSQKDHNVNFLIGFAVSENLSDSFLPITLIYNDTSFTGNPGQITSFQQLHKIIWQALGQGNFEVRGILLFAKYMSTVIVKNTAMFIILALLSTCNFFSYHTISDIKKEKRPYMEMYQLSYVAYYLGCFVVDYIIWAVMAVIGWAILLIIKSTAFVNHPVLSLFTLLLGGISTILVTYVWCFVFDEPESGSGFLNMLQQMPIYLTLFIETVRKDAGESVFAWIYSLYPLTNMYEFFDRLVTLDENYFEMWSLKTTFPLLLFMYVNIGIYIFILYLIESKRKKTLLTDSQSTFPKYQEFFSKIKDKQNLTNEVFEEEAQIKASSNSDYVIKIQDVCRVYLDNEGRVIPAVNSVSLGIKKGELYGFLGANGAGKTTMMKIITGYMSRSSGDVFIDGQSIDDKQRTTLISYCPQFNDHLTLELTPLDHIDLFGKLLNLDQETIMKAKTELVPLLELEEHKDKLVRELSGGNARKLAIIISFLSPYEVIILDEPTSSLDPVARHKVHDLINMYKGKKTFMLCTHLLEEAELLCGKISMMINGCVYTVGTPQYLSSKFGTEFKIDILLKSSNDEISQQVQNYITERIPNSKLTNKRSNNLVYSVPAANTSIKTLFNTLNEASQAISGIKYFTCASSSLEKVFLELVLLSSQSSPNEDVQL